MAVLTVADVLRMGVMRAARPRVVAGASGLGAGVRWVHAAELADIAALLREGDLLLSTGIAIPEGGAELVRFAESLSDSGAVGLVIELGRRWSEIPSALVDACEVREFPLIVLAREVRFAALTQAIGERLMASQLDELRQAQRVHETFTELSIAEAGPDAILAAVQRMSGAAVVLESEQHHVLDYRPGPGDIGEFLSDWAVRSRASTIEGRSGWDEANGWLVTRVGKRDRGWGRLVVQVSSPPSQGLIATAERAAAALALHRLHDRQRDTLLRRTHHELLVGLMTDPTVEDLLRRCALAGLPMNRRKFIGVTIRTRVGADPSTTAVTDRVDEVIAATVHAAHELKMPALVCEMDRDVRALLSLGLTADDRRAVDELAFRVQKRQAVLVGAGRPASRPDDIARTLREAYHVVQSVREGGEGPAVHRLEDVHLRGLLAMLSDDDRVGMFADRELDLLRRQDAREGSRLVEAVRALVMHPTSKSEAAASLHMSRPVFYDRLARVERLLGVDLDDPDIRVSLHVALLVTEVRCDR